MTPTMAPQWLAVRCKSTTCTTPGGRVLYRERVDGLVALRRHKRGVIAGVIVKGVPVALFCDCGWVWRSDSIAAVLNATSGWEDCSQD